MKCIWIEITGLKATNYLTMQSVKCTNYCVLDYVQKEVLHQKKEGRFILPSSKGTDMSPQHDHHSNRNIGKDMTPTLKQTTINPNKQIEDINESAEFRSSWNPTEFPHSKEGKM